MYNEHQRKDAKVNMVWSLRPPDNHEEMSCFEPVQDRVRKVEPSPNQKFN